MMKKPIKRSPQLAPFSREHHSALLCCWKIRQGLRYQVSIERILKYVTYFWTDILSAHLRTEENALFPVVNRYTIQKAKKEQVVRELIEDMIRFPQRAGEDKLERFANSLEQTIRFEERVLFPYLEKRLTAEELHVIGEHTAKIIPVQDDYDDSFWTQPGT